MARMDRSVWTSKQWVAYEHITNLIYKMMEEKDPVEVDCIHYEAKHLWRKYFPYEYSTEGDNKHVERMYIIRKKQLGNACSVTYNLYGCSITINN